MRDATINEALSAPVNFIVHDLADVNNQLTHGRPFFVDIARQGIALYEAEGTELATPRVLPPEEALAEARAHFDRWYPSASDFVRLARMATGEEMANKAAFLLHQATEQLYHCTLLTLTLYSPKSHKLNFLRSHNEVRPLNLAARERLRAGGELGDDVVIRTERGGREFATGDRVMFLKNERGLGVKNGTLGTVETVTRSRMTVMLDDGRSIAFDMKDYANIDHGYAATVHKAQGVTVDRVHVLATPGLDRHAAYVALSRHRDSVDLHYGRDDFADRGKLVRALSRERGKDMVSDYIRAPEKVPTKPVPSRSRFAGLKLKPIAIERQATPLERAVERYGRAAADIMRIRRMNLGVLEHQRVAFSEAGRALDALRRDGAKDLRSAMNANPELIEQAASGKTAAAIRAMTLEAEIRIDTAQRADRFVAEWQHKSR